MAGITRRDAEPSRMPTPFAFRIPGAASRLPLPELCQWAKQNGFSALDIGRPDPQAVQTIRQAGLDIGTFDLPGLSLLLSPDAAARERGAQTIAGAAAQARDLGLTRAFGVLVPPDKTQSRADSFGYWTLGWPKASQSLADAGVVLALEGWPGPDPYYPALGVAPETVRALLAIDQARGAGTLGLNFDPSHLARLGIDPIRFLSEFGSHVVHAHGKDTAFDSAKRYETGILGASLPADTPGSAASNQLGFGEGWWRYCVPGDGIGDWAGIAAGLHAWGYAGMVSMELEDARFNGTWEGEQQGLTRSRAYLARFF